MIDALISFKCGVINFVTSNFLLGCALWSLVTAFVADFVPLFDSQFLGEQKVCDVVGVSFMSFVEDHLLLK